MNYKQDDRPKRGWWAPGGYANKCRRCGSGFIGDKRAGWCADCAYEPTDNEMTAEPMDLIHALKALTRASQNYLDWKARPHEFTGEPLELLKDAIKRAEEVLKRTATSS